MLDHARSHNLGRGVDDAADGARRPQFAPLSPARIDALQRRAFVGSAVLVEIPVGNAVHRGHNAGFLGKQRLHRIDDAGDGMRLQADDDEVLRAKFGGVVGAARTRHTFFVADQKLQSIRLHRGKMGAARDQADVGARARELNPEITADRTGAVNADFHETYPEDLNRSWIEKFGRVAAVRGNGISAPGSR